MTSKRAKMAFLGACLIAAWGCASSPPPLPEAEAQAALTRGVASEEAGDLDQAEAAYFEAARSEALRPKALASLANVHAHRGDFEGAEKLYRQSILLQPTPPAVNNLAWMYVLYNRNLREAAALATLAAEIAHDANMAAECYHTAGLASALSGDLTTAVLRLRKGADLQMESGQVHGQMAFDLARHLLLAGQPQEALKALDQSETASDPALAARLNALRGAALRRLRGTAQSCRASEKQQEP